jgi:hypothetical protein
MMYGTDKTDTPARQPGCPGVGAEEWMLVFAVKQAGDDVSGALARSGPCDEGGEQYYHEALTSAARA